MLFNAFKEKKTKKRNKNKKKKNLWKYEILYRVYVSFMQVHCNKIKTFHIKTLTTYILNMRERESEREEKKLLSNNDIIPPSKCISYSVIFRKLVGLIHTTIY